MAQQEVSGAPDPQRAAKVAEEKNYQARSPLRQDQFTELLRRALRLSAASVPDMTLKDYCRQATALYDELTSLLRDRRLRDPDNQRLLNGARRFQQDRGSLLRFLSQDGVEPTNNRGQERDLHRPAVIARKVSHCSKNQRGAEAFEAFTSVLQTIRKTNPSALTASLTDPASLPNPLPAEPHSANQLQLLQNLVGNALQNIQERKTSRPASAAMSPPPSDRMVSGTSLSRTTVSALARSIGKKIFGVFKRLHGRGREVFRHRHRPDYLPQNRKESYGGRIWVESSLAMGQHFTSPFPTDRLTPCIHRRYSRAARRIVFESA